MVLPASNIIMLRCDKKKTSAETQCVLQPCAISLHFAATSSQLL